MELKLNNSRYLQISVILITTIVFFFITIGYWIYLNENSLNGYKFFNGINKLKLLDNEIDNVILSNQLEPLQQKIKLFQRELYFVKESSFFKNMIESNNYIKSMVLQIDLSFENKKYSIQTIQTRNISLLSRIKNITNNHLNYIKSDINILDIYRDVFIWFSSRDINLQETLEKCKKIKDNQETERLTYLISEIIMIDNLLIELTKGETLKYIVDFETVMTQEFYNNNSIINAIFYILISVSILFLLILIYLVMIEQQLQHELRNLNLSLRKKISKEVEKNREKDKLIYQQSKLVALGEMIGNISHHWRQPLNNLALSIQDIENAYYFGELDEEYIINLSNDSMKQINYLSSTIDDFRNFFKGNDTEEDFYISNMIDGAIAVTLSGTNIESIKLIKEIINDEELRGSKNQFSQVIINLIKNSKDVFNERKVNNPYIFIKLYRDENYIILDFADNGGGIPEKIIDRIFEPYFTTKHQSVGRGLGLYISKMIIEHNFNGELNVKNINEGAMFSIKIARLLKSN